MAEMKTIKGGCHCGAVRYEAEADLGQPIECNCSHCEKLGLILAFTPRVHFRLVKGGEKLNEYRFNRKVIAHQFCADCGTQPFAFATGQDGTPMAAINLRCVDGIDLSKIETRKFDGRKL